MAYADDISGAPDILAGGDGTWDNLTATTNPGEESLFFPGASDNTIWQKAYLAGSGPYVFQHDIAPAGDTAMSLYSGPPSAGYGDLVWLDEGDDEGGNSKPSISYISPGNEWIYIQSGGYGGDRVSGQTTIIVEPPPPSAGWNIANDHPWFGSAWVCDLGPYLGPADMLATATISPDYIQLDLAWGIPHPSGDPRLFAYGDYDTPIVDAARFYGFLPRQGTEVSVFTDSLGSWSGGVASVPPGAHLFVAWYPPGYPDDVSGQPPTLDPEPCAPGSYAARATGPELPSQVGTWSDWFPEQSVATGVFAAAGQSYIAERFITNRTFTSTPTGVVNDSDVSAGVHQARADDIDGTGPPAYSTFFLPQVGYQWSSSKEFDELISFSRFENGTFADVKLFDTAGSVGTGPPSPPFRVEPLPDLHELIDYGEPPPVAGYVNFNAAQYEDPSSPSVLTGWTGTFRVILNVVFNIRGESGGSPLGPAQGGLTPRPDFTPDSYRVGLSTPFANPSGLPAYGIGTTLDTITPALSLVPDSTGNISGTAGPDESADLPFSVLGDQFIASLYVQAGAHGTDILHPDNYSYPPASTDKHQLVWQYADVTTSTSPDAAAHWLVHRFRYYLLSGVAPPPPAVKQHPLRLRQRDDGLGSAGSTPRLAGSAAASPATSRQLGRVPRIGNPNRYS